MRLLIGLLPLLAFGQITNVRVSGVTSTQAVLSYTAPDTSACTVEVSEQPGYSPLVPDVDTALFSGENGDSRTGGVALGQQRTFVAGKQTTGLSGERWYSRALQADTPHYYRITCGGYQSTGTFKTANIPFGNTRSGSPPVDPNTAGAYALHTINGMARNETFTDWNTGALLKRISLPSDYRNPSGDDSIYDRLCSSAAGTNWSTPSAACNDDDSDASATYSGASCGGTCDWLYVSASTNFYNSTGVTLQYIRSKIRGSGTDASAANRTVEVCISRNGTSCDGETKEVALDQSLSTKTACDTVPCDTEPTHVDTWRALKDVQIAITDIDTDRCGSCTWGFLIRKKTSTGSISIENHKFDAVTSGNVSMSIGGDHDRCSNVASAGGYYYCLGYHGSGANTLYSVHGETGDIYFHGIVKGTCQVLPDSASFDSTDPKSLYTQCSQTLYKVTFTGSEGVDANPGATASLNWTAVQANLETTLEVFDATFDPAKYSCGLVGKQNNYLVLECRRGNQDSYGWIAIYNLTTSAFVAAMDAQRQPAFRWTGLHAYDTIGDQNTIMYTGYELVNGQTGMGPYRVRLEVGVDANVTTFDVTSDATSPNTGEPYSAYADNYLQDAAAGDIFLVDSERVRITGRSRLDASTVRWTVVRGVSGTTPASHAISANLTARGSGPCGYGDPTRCSTGANMLVWRFLDDPNGDDTTATYTWRYPYNGHMSSRKNLIIDQGYTVADAGVQDALYNGFYTFNNNVTNVPYFAGKYAPASGNTFQSYPTCHHVGAETWLTWFSDVRRLIGGDEFSSSVVLESGQNNTYKYGTLSATSTDRKHHVTLATCNITALRDISGPGSTIDDTKPYTYCVAAATNECRTGSAAGDIYATCPGLTLLYCQGGEVYGGGSDMCINDLTAVHGISQYKVGKSGPGTTSNWGLARNLTRLNMRYRRDGMTAKALANGKWHISNIHWDDRSDLFLVKTPPFPAKDIVNRQTFIPVPVQLSPPSALSVNNAIVEFGYDANFYCTSRLEACIANGSAVNETTPFTWPVEAGGESSITGVSCASGCTVSIPAFSGKVLYYRWKYRNISNEVISTSSMQIVAVP